MRLTLDRCSKKTSCGVFLGLLFFGVGFCGYTAYAANDLTVDTYYPAPALNYKEAKAHDFSSRDTEVKKKIEKQDRAFLASVDSLDKNQFPTAGAKDFTDAADSIYIGLFRDSSNASNVRPLRVLNGAAFAPTSSLIINKARHVSYLTENGETMSMWPGLGRCASRSIWKLIAGFAQCASDEYLADYSESPGLYLGGGVGSASMGNMGGGIGFKMSTINYTCCKLRGDEEPVTSIDGCVTKQNDAETARRNLDLAKCRYIQAIRDAKAAGCNHSRDFACFGNSCQDTGATCTKRFEDMSINENACPYLLSGQPVPSPLPADSRMPSLLALLGLIPSEPPSICYAGCTECSTFCCGYDSAGFCTSTCCNSWDVCNEADCQSRIADIDQKKQDIENARAQLRNVLEDLCNTCVCGRWDGIRSEIEAFVPGLDLAGYIGSLLNPGESLCDNMCSTQMLDAAIQ